MRLSRLLITITAAFAVLVASLATLGYAQAQEFQRKAAQAQAAIAQVGDAARSGDTSAITTSLEAARAQVAALRRTTTSAPWLTAERLPIAGTTLTAVDQTLAALDDILQSTSALEAAIALSPGPAQLLQRVPQLIDSLEPIQAAAQRASTTLGNIRDEHLLFGAGEALTNAQGQVEQLEQALTEATEAAPVLSKVLGFEGKHTYLVMLQNPAEARGSGGLFSAFMRITLDEGQITIDEANSRKILDDTRIPVPGNIDAGEQKLWGDYLAKWASFNTSPDFPTTAMLAEAGMQARGTPVDGVIAIDPATVEAILAGTGPVEHKGISIDSTNAYGFFTKGIYENFPGFENVEAKDDLTLGLLYATVDSVLNRPLDLPSLTTRLQQAAEENHIKAWLAHPAGQGWIDELGIGSSIAALPDDDQIYFLNNATGGKVDAYLTTTFETGIDGCLTINDQGEEVVQSTTRLTITNNAPENLPDYVDVRLDDDFAPKGSTRVLATIVGSRGASEQSASGAGDFTNVTASTFHGRPAWTSNLEIARGQSVTMEVTATTPAAQRTGLRACPSP